MNRDKQPSQRVFVLIPTHTTRHLACCLASLARQTRPPDGVVVTCDCDDAAIAGLLDEWWPRVSERLAERSSLLHTFRPHLGQARLNQVRNNGLRALRDRFGLRDEDLVVVLDGDTMLAPDALARHAGFAAAGFEVVIPYRHMIDESATAGVSAEAVLETGVPISQLTTAAEHASLEARHKRYQRHLVLSRLGLVKGHKPKIIGGHHAVMWRRLVEINGFDEEYIGYRFNDDDLSRRVRAVRPRTAIAVRDIRAFHLWHKQRAPERLEDAPGYARWSRKDLPTRCVHGIASPLEQPAPVVREVPATAASPVHSPAALHVGG